MIHRSDKFKNSKGLGRYAKYNPKPPLIKLLNELSPKSVLDLGCGKGYTLQRLHLNFPETQFTGIDFNKHFLETAEKLNHDITLIEADIEEIEELFKPKEFDLVYTHFVLIHFSKQKAQEIINSISTLNPTYIIHCESPGNGEIIANKKDFICVRHNYKEVYNNLPYKLEQITQYGELSNLFLFKNEN